MLKIRLAAYLGIGTSIVAEEQRSIQRVTKVAHRRVYDRRSSLGGRWWTNPPRELRLSSELELS